MTPEALFGIDDLFESVVDRLEALTFEVITRSQQSVSRLGFWLTTSFGAIGPGFVAASIATWHYATTSPWCWDGPSVSRWSRRWSSRAPAALEIEAVTPRGAAL